MNASEAKKKALDNEKQRKLERIESVLDDINEAVGKGELYITYYELEYNQISILKSMGYEIRENESFGEISYFISWQNAND